MHTRSHHQHQTKNIVHGPQHIPWKLPCKPASQQKYHCRPPIASSPSIPLSDPKKGGEGKGVREPQASGRIRIVFNKLLA